MVIQSFAHTEYDLNNRELRVYSRHPFDKTGLKIIGAVSVIFVQQQDTNGRCEDINTEVSSSLSVITVPEFNGQYFKPIDSKRSSSNNVIKRNVSHSEYTEDSRSNIGLFNSADTCQDKSRNTEEFSSNDVSVIDFSVPPDSTPMPHLQIVKNDDQKSLVQNIKQVHNAGLMKPPYLSVANSSGSPSSDVCMQVLKEIPKTVKMITDEHKINVHQHGQTNIPRITESALERKVPSSKTRLRLTRIKALVITRDKMSDVKCGICQHKLESATEIISHSKLHDLDLVCCVCEAKFASYCNMRRHCVGHVQTTLYMCSLCHCSYKRKDNLQSHIRKHYLKVGIPFRHLNHSYARQNSQSSRCFVFNKELGQKNEDGNTKYSEKAKSASSYSSDGSNVNRASMNTTTNVRPMESSLSNSQKNHIDLTLDDEPVSNSDEIVMNKSHSVTENVLGDKNMVANTKQLEDLPKEKLHPTHETEEVICLEENTYIRDKDLGPNRILNCSCSSCNLRFDEVENLKRHILLYHSEEIHTQNKVDTFGRENLDIVKTEHNGENLAAGNDSPIFDIGKLGEFTNQFTVVTQGTDSSVSIHSSNENTPMTCSASLFNNSPMTTLRKKGRYGDRLASITPICRICGIMFTDIQQSVDHKVEHPIEIPQMYGCTICTADLSSKECLRRHLKNHMGEEHQCYFCPSKYSRVDNLYTHMKNSHNWVKPYKIKDYSLTSNYNVYSQPK